MACFIYIWKIKKSLISTVHFIHCCTSPISGTILRQSFGRFLAYLYPTGQTGWISLFGILFVLQHRIINTDNYFLKFRKTPSFYPILV